MSWILGAFYVVGFIVGLIMMVLGCAALIHRTRPSSVMAGTVFLVVGLLACVWSGRAFNDSFLLTEEGRNLAEMRVQLQTVQSRINDVERLKRSLEAQAKPIADTLRAKGVSADDLRAGVPDDPEIRNLTERLAMLGHGRRRCEVSLRELNEARARYEGIIFYQENLLGLQKLAGLDELTVPSDVLLDDVRELARTPEGATVPLPQFSDEDLDQAAGWLD